MTDRELSKLGRTELLRLLIAQMKKNEKLEAQLREARAALERRDLMAADCGSLAEAAMRMNRLFETADMVVRDYLQNVKRHYPVQPEAQQEPQEDGA